MNSQNELSSDSTINDFEYDILDKINDYNELILLTQINSHICNTSEALKKLQDIRIIKSGDLILGFSGFIKLSNIQPFFNIKINEEIMKIASDDSVVFINSRISNTPLDFILKMYNSHILSNENYIIVSLIKILKNEEYREKCRIYSEFNKEDIKLWPLNEEELFLNNHKIESRFIDGKYKIKIYKLTKRNFQNFLKEFEKEIK